MLCNKLVDKGYVTKKYFKTVMERENMTPTSIGNGVAIPHGDTQEVNTAKIVIATNLVGFKICRCCVLVGC